MDKQAFKKLAELAKIEIGVGKEEKLSNDLEKILDYFGELKEVQTAGVLPMNGGTEALNVCRNDELVISEAKADDLINQFSKKEGRFLKVPGVFE